MNKKWLIWSTEHNGWWMPRSMGYTKLIGSAGRYSFDEALQICTGANYGLARDPSSPDCNIPHESMCLAPEDAFPDETK